MARTYCALSLLFLGIFAVSDAKTMKIPNQHTMPIMGISAVLFILQMVISFDWYILVTRLTLFILIFFFGMTGLLGMGDIKVMMILSLLNDPLLTLGSILAGNLCILAFYIIQRIWKRRKHRYKDKTEETKKEYTCSCQRIAFVPYLFYAYGGALLYLTCTGKI